MKLNVKEYFKLSLIYTVIAALPSLLQFFAQPFIFGPCKLNSFQNSYLAITEIITSLVFVVTTYAMGNAISRFYYDYIEDKKGYNRLVSSVFNSIIIRGILLLLLGVVISNYVGKYFSQKELQDFPTYGYASIILGINRAICLTAFALYRNEKKVKRFIIFNISLGILRTGFQMCGLFFYKMTFIGYLYGGCIGSGITTIAILGYTYYYSGIHLDFKILKSLNHFGRPLFIYSLIGWGLMYTGRFFLESYPKELGIYYLAINCAIGIQLVLQGIQGATQPEFFKFMKMGLGEHQKELKRLGNLLLVQTQALIGILIIPTMLYITFFFHKSDLKSASTFICIIFIDLILKTQTNLFSYPIYYLKKTKFLFVVNTSVLLLNLLMNYLLAPIYKAYGLILSTIVCDLILTTCIYIYQNRLCKINWNINKILIYPFAIVFIASILEILKNISHIHHEYFISAVVVIAIFTGIFLLYKNEIRGMILKYTGYNLSILK